jgi:acyl carrier protein
VTPVASTGDIYAVVRKIILDEFLPGEDPDVLENVAPLLTSGLLDSIDLFRLVNHLENSFGVSFGTTEVSIANLNTVDSIVCLVSVKINHIARNDCAMESVANEERGDVQKQ